MKEFRVPQSIKKQLSKIKSDQLNTFINKLIGVLTNNLHAIYLNGSMARKCYNRITSDIDVLVKNPVLSLCRYVYTMRNKKLCSKIEAGDWALKNIDVRFHDIIRIDLENYINGKKRYSIDNKLLGELVEYCRNN